MTSKHLLSSSDFVLFMHTQSFNDYLLDLIKLSVA